MVIVKGMGLTMVAVASMTRLWAPEDMEIWVTWTSSEIDGKVRLFPVAGTLGRTDLNTIRVVEVSW